MEWRPAPMIWAPVWMNTADRMKTTIEIADTLVKRAKRVQRRQNVTMRALVEEGLQLALDRRDRVAPFVYKPVVVDGKGLTRAARDAGWRKLIEMANDR